MLSPGNCALESRGGPGLSAFEHSEDATKGPQGALMHVVTIDKPSNLFRAMAMHACNSKVCNMSNTVYTSAIAPRKTSNLRMFRLPASLM